MIESFVMEGIPFQLIRSDRKTLAIQIKGPDEILLRAPLRMPKEEIIRFVKRKWDWILAHRQKVQEAVPQSTLPPFTYQELQEMAHQALAIIPARAACFASQLGVSYHGITIRNQKSKWGSCSGKGNLNFNCLLLLTPPEILDYVVAHEICHLKEMNHSPRFWQLVAGLIPDYQEKRKWLKDHGAALIARLG